MTATRQDVKITAGDSRIIACGPVKNEDGTYADLLGATARWWLAKKVPPSSSADIFLRKSTDTGGGILITSQTLASGQITYTVEVVLNSLDTISIPPVQSQYHHYFHELEVTDVLGGVFTVTAGHFDVLPGLVAPPESAITGQAFAADDVPRTATIAIV